MKVKILLNGTMREAEISSDQLLIDLSEIMDAIV